MSSVCPLCKTEAKFLFNTKDHNEKITDQVFAYWQCSDCQLIFLPDIPANLGEYYQESYYEIPSLENLSRIASANEYQINFILKFVTSGNLLEIGPSFGTFSLQAKKAGFKVDVIEMDKRCCEFLSKSVGVNAVNSNCPEQAIDDLEKHDVIALWHNIEHLPNPWAFLKEAAKNLNPGGVLLIAAPNPSSFGFRVLGPLWPHVDAPRHLNLIPVQLLTKYLNSAGLELVMMTTKDKGARSWNRFGWQRFLMNYFSSKIGQMVAFIVGGILSLPLALWEFKGVNGSAYTAIYQKKSIDDRHLREKSQAKTPVDGP